MPQNILRFYESLADFYHLIFEDWDRAILRQAEVLDPLLRAQFPQDHLRILDCACGIGTQAIGLALKGHDVVGSDLSPAAVARAKHEAEARGVSIDFYTSDVTSLAEILSEDFDVVAALDNALPHLSREQLAAAVSRMKAKLRPGGVFIASLRDYDAIIQQKPTTQEPSFYGTEGDQRIVHQVWDWAGDESYVAHLYITAMGRDGWECRHFATDYRCLLREELSCVLEAAGFTQVKWMMPAESRYYQPLVVARSSAAPVPAYRWQGGRNRDEYGMYPVGRAPDFRSSFSPTPDASLALWPYGASRKVQVHAGRDR